MKVIFNPDDVENSEPFDEFTVKIEAEELEEWKANSGKSNFDRLNGCLHFHFNCYLIGEKKSWKSD